MTSVKETQVVIVSEAFSWPRFNCLFPQLRCSLDNRLALNWLRCLLKGQRHILVLRQIKVKRPDTLGQPCPRCSEIAAGDATGFDFFVCLLINLLLVIANMFDFCSWNPSHEHRGPEKTQKENVTRARVE